MFLKYAWGEKYPDKKIFELPHSCDRDFSTSMPVFGRIVQPNSFISSSRTYITADGFDDCDQQLLSRL